MSQPSATSAPIFLTGATGFVGQHVLHRLLTENYTVRALVRRAGTLPRDPRLSEVVGDLTKNDTPAAALSGCTAIIHLVGIIEEHPRQGATFQAVHVEATRNLLAAAKAAGLRRFVHMSALGTRPNAASAYHQTKWAAEELVRNAGLDYTIFRPSLILGPDGEFATMLRDWTLARRAPWFFMPYFGAGLLGQANPNPLTPIHVDDVAAAFVAALTTPASLGKTYQLGGPDTLTWRQLLHAASAAFRPPPHRPKPALGIPAWYAQLLTYLPLPLPFNRAQIQMSQEPNAADLTAFLADFPHLRPRPFRDTLAACVGRLGVRAPA